MMKKNILLVLLAACAAEAPPSMTPPPMTGGGGGGGGGSGGSGSGSGGGGNVVLNGTAQEQGQGGASPLAGVAIAVYATGNDGTPVATATSDGSGKFTIDLTTATFDGYLKATKSDYADTYFYPAHAWSGATTVEPSLLSSSTYSLLDTFAGGDTSKGLIIATITDGSGTPVSGAKITSSPASGSYKYSDGSGTPTGSSATPADGTAFFMSVPLGAVTLNAQKSGATFTSHAVTSRAGALVITYISE